MISGITEYEPGTHRLYQDLVAHGGLIIPAGTILVVPSEEEQERWRNLTTPTVEKKSVSDDPIRK